MSLGARSMLMPTAARSVPSARYTAAVSATSSTAPRAALPGYGLPVRCASLVTSPPSSSIAMTGSGPAARSAAVSADNCSGPDTLGPNKVTPASPFSSARSSQRGAE